jgi:hypothetical protein
MNGITNSSWLEIFIVILGTSPRVTPSGAGAVGRAFERLDVAGVDRLVGEAQEPDEHALALAHRQAGEGVGAGIGLEGGEHARARLDQGRRDHGLEQVSQA